MNIYDTLQEQFPLIGNTDDRPAVPPDKEVMFWDKQAGVLYAVNDSMEWVAINPGRTFVDTFTDNISYFESPSHLLFHALDNYKILAISLKMLTPYDGGAAITIGDNADVDRLMAVSENDPTDDTGGFFTVYPQELLLTERDINLYTTSDDPMTQGIVSVNVMFDRNAFA